MFSVSLIWKNTECLTLKYTPSLGDNRIWCVCSWNIWKICPQICQSHQRKGSFHVLCECLISSEKAGIFQRLVWWASLFTAWFWSEATHVCCTDGLIQNKHVVGSGECKHPPRRRQTSRFWRVRSAAPCWQRPCFVALNSDLCGNSQLLTQWLCFNSAHFV